MKHLLLSLVATLAVALNIATVAPARADAGVNCTVGVIDMSRVAEGYERYAASRKVLEARKAELQNIVDDEEKSVLAMIEELDAMRATGSQEEIARRRREVEGRDRELREFVGSTNGQFRDDLDTLQFRTKTEIETVVQEISKIKGLSLVLERNMTLFSGESLDITDDIIIALNARFRPIAMVPAAASPATRRPAISGTGAPGAPATALPAPSTDNRSRGWPFRDQR